MGHFWKKVHSLFKKIDIFAVPTKVRCFNDDQFQTIYGSFLTITLVGILATKTLTMLFDSLTLNTFSYSIDTTPDLENNILVDNFTLVVCPAANNNPFYFTYSPLLNLNGLSSKLYEPYKCSLTALNSIFDGAEPFCYCYDLMNNTLKDSTNVLNLTVSMARIGINTTTPPSTLDEMIDNEPIKSTDYDLCFFYQQKFVDTKDYINPVKSRDKMKCFTGINEREIYVDFFFDNIQIKRENTFAMLLQGKDNDNFNITRVSDIKVDNSAAKVLTNNPNLGIQFAFYHSGWQTVYTFNGFDSDEFFSTLGGFYEIVIWLFTFIGNFLNEKIKNCYLRRKLMNRIEENALDGFEFYFHKTKIKKELEKIKLEQVPCNLNDTSIPSKSENENLRSQKNEGGQKSNVSSSNNNISTVNNTSKEPIKIIPKITEQLKKNQATLIHVHQVEKNIIEKKKHFHPVKQFEEYLDLVKLYQLIKEVKLLEIMCLNVTNGFLFFNALKCEMNLNQLDQKISELFSKETLENESEKVSNSYEKRISLVKECLIINKPKLKTLNSLIQSK